MDTNLNALPPQRPDCFESAMEFLDEPEAPVLLAYVEALEARVALAQPEPQMPTDEELLRTYGKAMLDYCYEGPLDDWPKQAERAATVHGLRAVLAMLDRAPFTPIPVSERLPGPADCAPWPDEPDSDPWLWGTQSTELLCSWRQVSISYFSSYVARPNAGTVRGYTHWAPHWAFPLPQPTTTPPQSNV
jgi:hypothetical protein